jgi:apolipoprotein N-acyltransferase
MAGHWLTIGWAGLLLALGLGLPRVLALTPKRR